MININLENFNNTVVLYRQVYELKQNANICKHKIDVINFGYNFSVWSLYLIVISMVHFNYSTVCI